MRTSANCIDDLRTYLYKIIDKVEGLKQEMEDAKATPPLAQWKVNLDEIANMADMADGCALWSTVEDEE